MPIGLAVDGANRNDFKMMKETLESIPVKRPKPTRKKPQGLCLDKGYDYDEVRDLAKEFGYTAHIRTRGEEAQALKRQAGFKARRWVVERTHSWMNRFRRILTRWEKKAENYLGLLHLVCAVITYRCAGLFGHHGRRLLHSGRTGRRGLFAAFLRRSVLISPDSSRLTSPRDTACVIASSEFAATWPCSPEDTTAARDCSPYASRPAPQDYQHDKYDCSLLFHEHTPLQLPIRKSP